MNTALAYFRTREIQVSCNECGCLTNLDYFDDHDGLCPQCWDQRHICAGCGREFDEELPGKSDYRYCDSCYRENSEAIIKHVVREVHKLVELSRQELALAKKKYMYCNTPNYLAYGAILAGHMVFLCGQLRRIAGELEEI